jgi:hypothetical protein
LVKKSIVKKIFLVVVNDGNKRNNS